MSLSIIILAAGKGARMTSNLPKVLQPLAKKPLLSYVINTAKLLNPNEIIVVVGHQSELIKETFKTEDVIWKIQDQQLGTGHAVLQAVPSLKSEKTIILYGDVPLVEQSDLLKLVEQSGNSLAVMTYIKDVPNGYGRIQRENAEVVSIIEDKDCNDDQRKIKEINTGIMTADTQKLIKWLSKLSNNNSQKEYYLTDIVALATAEGEKVYSHKVLAEITISGVNSKAELVDMERKYQSKLAQTLVSNGAHIIDPNRIDIRGELIVGRDVTIDVGCIFEGDVTLGDNVYIHPYCVLKNCKVKSNSTIESFSYIDSSEIGKENKVGPYARIRPGTVLGNTVHIGNFVEIKNSSIDEFSKVNHLSYIGDSDIGRNVNVGAGTITCNYDGANKHRTTIEDDVFIGSNSQLVAPIKIGKGSTIGAGSTITKDTPDHQLTLSRSKQINITGWKRPSKKK